jgi:hypothetical protein
MTGTPLHIASNADIDMPPPPLRHSSALECIA